MATVGNLFINVNASTAKFNSKMKGAQKRLSMFKTAVAGIASAMATAFGVRKIVAWTREAMNAIDATAKLARSIGVTTAELQIFRHAAQLTGLEAAQADKGFRDMVRRVGEAAGGAGEAKLALESLGIKIADLAQMDAPAMFGVIADKIVAIEEPAIRAAAAYDIFGRSGISLLNTMALGSSGMADVAKQLEGMGVLITDFSAQRVEKANDALATLGLTVKDLANDFAIGLAPAIEQAAEALTDSGRGGGPGFMEAAGFAVGEMAQLVYNPAENVGVKMIGAMLDKTTIASAATSAASVMINEMYGPAEDAAKPTGATIAEDLTDGVAAGMAANLEEMRDLATAWAETPVGALEKLNKEIVGLETAWETLFAAWEAGTIDTDLATAAIEQLRKQLGELERERTALTGPTRGVAEFDPGVTAGVEALKGIMTIELPDIKGMVDTVDTAIGSFRVEGDQRGHVQDRQLEVERQQLDALRQIGESVEAQQGLIGIMGLLR